VGETAAVHRWLGFLSIAWSALLLRLGVVRPKKDDLAFFVFRQQWNRRIARAFHFVIDDAGPRPGPGTLIVSNHFGMADICVLVCTLPPAALPNFISKIEIGRIPVFGWHMFRYGDILFDRKNADERKQILFRSLARLKAGFSLVLFPEGTRSRTGEPKAEIRPALIELAIKEGLPIQPVAVRGTLDLLEHPSTMKAQNPIVLRYGTVRRDYQSAAEVWRDVLALWGQPANPGAS
jgi:1-acyl-sn-glycerol-3-phosphate acyltransferase